jgi:hypothetical protein
MTVRLAPKSILLIAIRVHHAKQFAVEMLVRAKKSYVSEVQIPVNESVR